jgi:ABC-type amino acid transport substrate-binding protein
MEETDAWIGDVVKLLTRDPATAESAFHFPAARHDYLSPMARLVCCLLAALFASIPFAPAAPIKVALAGAPPFVIQQSDGAGGFVVELWQSVATDNQWQFEYRPYATTAAALQAVARGECDVLVGDTSITSDRERFIDFSQPFYRAGLQIMVSENRGHFGRLVSAVLAPQHLKVLFWAVLGVLIATVSVEAFERRHNPDFPKTRPAGVAEAFYYVMGLVTGKSSYKGFPGVLGRLVLVGWMVASLLVVSYVMGAITSAMATDALQGQVHSAADLPGKMVGLVGGSQSEEYARAHNLDYAAYDSLDAAVTALVKGTVQCLVGDAPVLQYYDYTHSRVPVHEVGPVFQPVNYGFAMPVSSPLREPINVTLLHLNESGALDDLGKKYFGSSYQK